MQYYRLELKPIVWPHLTNEQLIAKMRVLLDIGAHVMDSSFSDFQPDPKPEPEVRYVNVHNNVEVFVCPFPKCVAKFQAKSSMLRHYQRKPESIPLKVTR